MGTTRVRAGNVYLLLSYTHLCLLWVFREKKQKQISWSKDASEKSRMVSNFCSVYAAHDMRAFLSFPGSSFL